MSSGERRSGGFKAALSLGAAAAFLVLGFQNCSQPLPVDPDAELLALSKIEFAYDTTIDQISHMSCAVAQPGTFDTGAYYSYRFGAYRNAGLKLSDTFIAAEGRKPPARQAEILTESPANVNTNIQFSIRPLINFQGMYTSSGTPVRGQDYVNIFEALGTNDLADLLARVEQPTRVKYLRNGTVFGTRMEGSLYFTTNPTLAGSIRTNLRNDAFLAQTYAHLGADTSADTTARGPGHIVEGSSSNVNTQVYGRGYNLKFSRPSIGATPSNANFPDVILSEVTERHLLPTQNQALPGTWSCPDTVRFRIARPEDVRANRITCSMAPDPAIPTTELTIVRNQLRVEDWYVDMVNRCVVPKKAPATCYGTTATSVQYDITQTCTEGTGAACVSFVSFCYRQ